MMQHYPATSQAIPTATASATAAIAAQPLSASDVTTALPSHVLVSHVTYSSAVAAPHHIFLSQQHQAAAAAAAAATSGVLVNPTQVQPEQHERRPMQSRVHDPYAANVVASHIHAAQPNLYGHHHHQQQQHHHLQCYLQQQQQHQMMMATGTAPVGSSRGGRHGGRHGAPAPPTATASTSLGGGSGASGAKAQHYANPISTQELLGQRGQLARLARTANGSSFIQAALRDDGDLVDNLPIIWTELQMEFTDLLLDAHGCYVTKTVMERLSESELADAVAAIAMDEQLVFSLCTHSLHTRRVVQFLMDMTDCAFIIDVLVNRCAEVATTQQGCIVMQRAMEVATGAQHAQLLSAIHANLLLFAVDPFANYVIQRMLEVGDRRSNSAAIFSAFRGHIHELASNKFSSNVVEKALVHVEPEVQHALLVELYDASEEGLLAMLQDSFANYLIQSSIALAAYSDVFLINEKLRPVLDRTPYGYKIVARLDRRLKGKPVGTRSPGQVVGRGGGMGGPPRGGGGGVPATRTRCAAGSGVSSGSQSVSTEFGTTPQLHAQDGANTSMSVESLEEPW